MTAPTRERPESRCPLCGAAALDIYCDACEVRENETYLAGNSIPDDRGVATGDDPRR